MSDFFVFLTKNRKVATLGFNLKMEIEVPTSKTWCLHCPNNHCNGLASTAELVEGHPHAALCVCPKNVDHYWFFCRQCEMPSHRVWTTKRSLNAHTRKFHGESKCAPTSVAEDSVFVDDMGDNLYPEKVVFAHCPELLHGSTSSKRFFYHDYCDRGCHYLVSNSFYKNSVAHTAVHDSDVEVQMRLASLANKLTRDENAELADLLRVTIQHTEAARKRSCGTWKTSIPVTSAELRNRIIDGPRSVLKNLPTPSVRMVDETHAYVSVIDCLADLLGHGFELDRIVDGNGHNMGDPNMTGDDMGNNMGDRNMTGDDMGITYPMGNDIGNTTTIRSVSESPAAMKILSNGKLKHPQEVFFCVYFVEWYDDLDPNSSIKKNRGGVWLKTITFGAPRNSRNSPDYTYVVACGPKDGDHEEAEKALQQDIQRLLVERHMFYSKRHGQTINIHAELLASLADQLARRAENYLTAGNGTYGARWGYAADLYALMAGVPACETCIAALYSGELTDTCPNCTNWNMDIDSSLLDMDPPKKYPASQLPATRKLRPKKMTYESLMAAAGVAHDSVVSGEWAPDEALVFLETEGFNKGTGKRIVVNAENTRIYQL